MIREPEHVDVFACHETEGLRFRCWIERHEHGGVEALFFADERFEEIFRRAVEQSHERQLLEQSINQSDKAVRQHV